MSIFGNKNNPMAPPPVPDAPPPPPTFASSQISHAGEQQVRKSVGGYGSTILTSAQGDTSAPSLGKKTLLGA